MPIDKPQSTPEEVMASLNGALEQVDVFHNRVLVAIYMGEGITAGGVILPDKLKDEDRWQGKVGLVLKTGPIAFKDDMRNTFAGVQIGEGEWVMFNVNDGFAIDVAGVHCRLLQDIHIQGRVATPKIIY